MNKDWIFVVDNSICDVRTVGVLIRDGKILVQRDLNGNEYASFHNGLLDLRILCFVFYDFIHQLTEKVAHQQEKRHT